MPPMATFLAKQSNNSCITLAHRHASHNSDQFILIGDTLYTLGQLIGIARRLYKWKNIVRLANLMRQIPFEVVTQCHQLLYSSVYVRFQQGNYREVISLLSDSSPMSSTNRAFDESHYRELQAIWDECHYRLFEQEKGKYPQEVQRFRIRKRHIYPASIWNGDKFKYSFTLKDREVMEKYFKRNPKPNRKVKEELAEKTNLTVQQVTTWFKNKRNRHTRNVNDSDDSNDLEERVSSSSTVNRRPSRSRKSTANTLIKVPKNGINKKQRTK